MTSDMKDLSLIQRTFEKPIRSMADSKELPVSADQPASMEIPRGGSHGTLLWAPTWNEGTYRWPDKNEEHLDERGTAFLYHFPFSISCADLPELAITLGVTGKVRALIYPPFNNEATIGLRSITWESIPANGGNPRRRFEPLQATQLVPAARGKRECSWLRIDLLVNEPAPKEGIPVEESILGNPEHLVHRLLELIRFRTRQWWVTRDNGARMGSLAAAFPIVGNSLIHGFPTNVWEIAQAYEIPLAVTSDVWLDLIKDLGAGTRQPRYDSRLLDSYYFCAAKDIDASVLALAQAAEIARTVHLQRVGMKKHGEGWDLTDFLQGRADLGRDRWALPRHIDDVAIAAKLTKKGFSSQSPKDWRAIDSLWDARGNVAHGHAATFESSGKTRPVTLDLLVDWFEAVRNLIGWLEIL